MAGYLSPTTGWAPQWGANKRMPYLGRTANGRGAGGALSDYSQAPGTADMAQPLYGTQGQSAADALQAASQQMGQGGYQQGWQDPFAQAQAAPASVDYSTWGGTTPQATTQSAGAGAATQATGPIPTIGADGGQGIPDTSYWDDLIQRILNNPESGMDVELRNSILQAAYQAKGNAQIQLQLQAANAQLQKELQTMQAETQKQLQEMQAANQVQLQQMQEQAQQALAAQQAQYQQALTDQQAKHQESLAALQSQLSGELEKRAFQAKYGRAIRY